MELNGINMLSPKLKGKIDRVVKQWVDTNLTDERLTTEINRLLDQSLETAIMTWLGFERDTWNRSWVLTRASGRPLPDCLDKRRDSLMAEVIKRLDFQPEVLLSQTEIKDMRAAYRRELIKTGQDLAARRGDEDGYTIIDRIIGDIVDERLSVSVAEALEEE